MHIGVKSRWSSTVCLAGEEAIIDFQSLLQKQWPASYLENSEMVLYQKVEVEKHDPRAPKLEPARKIEAGWQTGQKSR